VAQGAHGPFAGQNSADQLAHVIRLQVPAGGIGEQPPVCGGARRVAGSAAHYVDESHLRKALFGSEQLTWLHDRVTGSVVPGSIQTKRIPDGYWRPVDERGTRISAVLFGNTISASSVASNLPELWINPRATTPLPGLATGADLFGLPPEWPNRD
jgi:hypothetical protein